MKKQQRAAIYGRVSTSGQSTTAQTRALREYVENRGWTVTEIYTDTISGTKESRPGLDRLMADSRRRKHSIVVVFKFDRFARSVSHLLRALETFEELGIEFVSISESIDTSTAAGKMVFTVLGAVAALERSLIGERVRLGIQNARKEGRRIGRPPAKELTANEIKQIRSQRSKGATLREISTRFKVPMSCAYRVSSRGFSKLQVKNARAR